MTEIANKKMVTVLLPVSVPRIELQGQLEAFCNQDYDGPWELILCANREPEWVADFVEKFVTAPISVRIVPANEKHGQAYARNTGAALAKGEYLAFCDDDDIVSEHWISGMVEALAVYDAVDGFMETTQLNAKRAIDARLMPFVLEESARPQFLFYASTGNMGIRAAVFDSVDRFDADLPGSSDDKDLSWRLQYAGHTVGQAPNAVIHYRYRSSARGIWSQQYGYGFGGPFLYQKHRDRGMPRSPTRLVLFIWLKLSVGVWQLMFVSRRWIWISRVAYRWGRVRGSIAARTIYL